MRLRRLMLRWILLPVVVIALPVVAILFGGYAWLSTSLPETTGSIELAGLLTK